jgi:hypothetical protein
MQFPCAKQNWRRITSGRLLSSGPLWQCRGLTGPGVLNEKLLAVVCVVGSEHRQAKWQGEDPHVLHIMLGRPFIPVVEPHAQKFRSVLRPEVTHLTAPLGPDWAAVPFHQTSMRDMAVPPNHVLFPQSDSEGVQSPAAEVRERVGGRLLGPQPVSSVKAKDQGRRDGVCITVGKPCISSHIIERWRRRVDVRTIGKRPWWTWSRRRVSRPSCCRWWSHPCWSRWANRTWHSSNPWCRSRWTNRALQSNNPLCRRRWPSNRPWWTRSRYVFHRRRWPSNFPCWSRYVFPRRRGKTKGEDQLTILVVARRSRLDGDLRGCLRIWMRTVSRATVRLRAIQSWHSIVHLA